MIAIRLKLLWLKYCRTSKGWTTGLAPIQCIYRNRLNVNKTFTSNFVNFETYMQFYVSIYLTHSRGKCNTRSILSGVITGWNTEFSFSKTGYQTKVKDPNLSNYLRLARENMSIHTFSENIRAKYIAISPVWDLNSSQRFHFQQRQPLR